MDTRGQTTSPWMTTAPVMDFSALKQDVEADVCVVGAGITGLTTAYLAVKAGLKVVVIEASEVAAGETGRTTAHFVTAHDNRMSEIIRIHGLAKAKVVAESLVESINLVERIIKDEKIECDFERLPGYLYLAPGDSSKILALENKASERVGLKGVKLVGEALEFSQQAQLHITKYLTGLCRAIQANGGQIFTHTRMSGLQAGSPVTVNTENGPVVRAKWVVQATNSPAYAPMMQFLKLPPMRTYVVGATVRAGSLPHALYWDTGQVYHYTRLQATDDPKTELLLVGGEDHQTGTVDDATQRFQRLEKFTRATFPQVGQFNFHWSGQVLESIDGLAYIGAYKKIPGVLYATGDSGMGMTHGTIAAMILTDHMLGKLNPWAAVYQPNRWPLKILPILAKEANRLTWAYVKGWFGRSNIQPKDLSAGQGAVVKQGKKRLAVYKDQQGQLHSKSAVCPHMKCIVAWNTIEQSWDCPCHGSRFEASGKMLNAPTLGSLPPRKLK